MGPKPTRARGKKIRGLSSTSDREEPNDIRLPRRKRMSGQSTPSCEMQTEVTHARRKNINDKSPTSNIVESDIGFSRSKSVSVQSSTDCEIRSEPTHSTRSKVMNGLTPASHRAEAKKICLPQSKKKKVQPTAFQEFAPTHLTSSTSSTSHEDRMAVRECYVDLSRSGLGCIPAGIIYEANAILDKPKPKGTSASIVEEVQSSIPLKITGECYVDLIRSGPGHGHVKIHNKQESRLDERHHNRNTFSNGSKKRPLITQVRASTNSSTEELIGASHEPVEEQCFPLRLSDSEDSDGELSSQQMPYPVTLLNNAYFFKSLIPQVYPTLWEGPTEQPSLTTATGACSSYTSSQSDIKKDALKAASKTHPTMGKLLGAPVEKSQSSSGRPQDINETPPASTEPVTVSPTKIESLDSDCDNSDADINGDFSDCDENNASNHTKDNEEKMCTVEQVLKKLKVFYAKEEYKTFKERKKGFLASSPSASESSQSGVNKNVPNRASATHPTMGKLLATPVAKSYRTMYFPGTLRDKVKTPHAAVGPETIQPILIEPLDSDHDETAADDDLSDFSDCNESITFDKKGGIQHTVYDVKEPKTSKCKEKTFPDMLGLVDTTCKSESNKTKTSEVKGKSSHPSIYEALNSPPPNLTKCPSDLHVTHSSTDASLATEAPETATTVNETNVPSASSKGQRRLRRSSKRTKSSKPKPEIENYSCDLCDQTFKSLRTQKLHMSACQKKFPFLHFKREKPGEPGLESYDCPVCQKTFTIISSRNRHMESHLPKRTTHKCDICGKKYNSKFNLNRHIHSKHSNEPKKTAQCHICGQTCSSDYFVRLHIARKHQENRPRKFLCDICGHGSTERIYHNQHLLTHTKVKKYKCNICSKAFARSDYLLRHMPSHDDIKKFQCSRCGKGFSRNQYLNKHVESNICNRPGYKPIQRKRKPYTQAQANHEENPCPSEVQTDSSHKSAVKFGKYKACEKDSTSMIMSTSDTRSSSPEELAPGDDSSDVQSSKDSDQEISSNNIEEYSDFDWP